MKPQIVQYTPETIEQFKGNPLIEALPPRINTAEVIRKLTFRPPFSENDREASAEDRGMMVQTLLRIYQPCEKDIDIYAKVFSISSKTRPALRRVFPRNIYRIPATEEYCYPFLQSI